MGKRGIGVMAALGGVCLLLVLTWNSGVLHVRGEEVTIDAGDVRLAGALALPRWRTGPFPAAVIVHGSGRERRQDLRGYAGYLTRAGMAVLMFDRRGVGESGGSYLSMAAGDGSAAIETQVRDVLAAVAALRAREDIDPRRIGLVGGSQAGWTMPGAATIDTAIAFVVAISGTPLSFGEQDQYRRLAMSGGLSPDEAARRLRGFGGPKLFDPDSTFRRLRVPSLWLYGAQDRIVPAGASVDRLREFAAEAPARWDWHVFPKGDHSLVDVETGRRIDYRPMVLAWIAERGMLD